MSTKTITPKAVLFVLVLSAFACGIADRFTGGGQMKTATELWGDVPRMEGITKSDGEMPSWLRLVVRPALSTMMRGVNDGKDAGVWDVVFYTATGKTPREVTDFYSPERMTNYGWERKGDANCINLSGDSVVLCAFTKHVDDKDVGLAVIAALDDKEKQTSIFFMRNDTTPAPTPNR